MQHQFIRFLLIFQLIAFSKISAQNVAINATGNLPDTSALLDLSSTTKGLLIPRMTAAQQIAIASPATGLIVFNSSANQFKYNFGTSALPAWETILATSSGWGTAGNGATVDGTNFIGTTSNTPLTIKVNNQNAGRIDNLNGITGLGYQSLNNNSGANNTAFGQAALFTNTTGTGNTAIGYQSAYFNSSANNITSIGYQAGFNNITNNNSFFGYQAGYTNTTGVSVTASGFRALYANSSGTSNTAFGAAALTANTTGGYNTGVGAGALQANTTGQTNTAVGQFSLGANTTGNGNTGIGQSALSANTTGTSNSALGASSLGANTSGTANVAIGQSAMLKNSTGNFNTVIGQGAMDYSVGGSNKTAIGYQAGSNDSLGGNNTYLGYQADQAVPKTTALTNASAIGYLAKVSTSNSLVLGGTAGNAVNVGIGTTSPSAVLDVVGKTKTSTFQITGGAANAYVLTSDAAGNGTWQAGGGGGGWSLSGNAGTTYASGFIGTTDNVSLRIRTSNLTRMIIDSLGNVGVGTVSPTQKFHVVGNDTATSVIAASTTVLGQYENGNNGSTCIDLKTTNTGHTLTTRIGINPTYTSTGGAGVMACYANYDGNYRILNSYDYVNNNFLIAPAVPGYTVNKVGVNLAQAVIGSELTVNGGLAVSNGSTSYSTTASPAGGAIIEGKVGIGTTAPLSSLDNNGSFAAAIATVSASITLDATYFTVIITAGPPVITLPVATSCARRIYIIINQTGAARTISSYKNLGGVASTTIATVSSIMIQSNGTAWYQIR